MQSSMDFKKQIKDVKTGHNFPTTATARCEMPTLSKINAV